MFQCQFKTLRKVLKLSFIRLNRNINTFDGCKFNWAKKDTTNLVREPESFWAFALFEKCSRKTTKYNTCKHGRDYPMTVIYCLLYSLGPVSYFLYKYSPRLSLSFIGGANFSYLLTSAVNAFVFFPHFESIRQSIWLFGRHLFPKFIRACDPWFRRP